MCNINDPNAVVHIECTCVVGYGTGRQNVDIMIDVKTWDGNAVFCCQRSIVCFCSTHCGWHALYSCTVHRPNINSATCNHAANIAIHSTTHGTQNYHTMRTKRGNEESISCITTVAVSISIPRACTSPWRHRSHSLVTYFDVIFTQSTWNIL